MHLEVLVEGQVERTALEPLLSKIVGPYGRPNTWAIHKHQGKGALPDNPFARPNPKDNSLLHNLPASLRAFGRSLRDSDVVVVLVDLDADDCHDLKRTMIEIHGRCNPRPNALFRMAIEELEAWFLGDRVALLAAYPKARRPALDSYVQDSICSTWEILADTIYPGGARALKRKGRSASVEEKRVWAKNIAPHMNVENNLSHSFCVFRDGIRRVIHKNH